jgi:hypothetical protein
MFHPVQINRPKKKTKSEKKWEKLQQQLESSDKFFKESIRPILKTSDGEYCADTLNCIKVLMEPPGHASVKPN